MERLSGCPIIFIGISFIIAIPAFSPPIRRLSVERNSERIIRSWAAISRSIEMTKYVILPS